MKVVEELIKRIRKDLGVDIVEFKRGYLQNYKKTEFSWEAKKKENGERVYSQLPATVLVNKKKPLEFAEKMSGLKDEII